MTTLTSTDPRTGAQYDTGIVSSTTADVDSAATAAATAADGTHSEDVGVLVGVAAAAAPLFSAPLGRQSLRAATATSEQAAQEQPQRPCASDRPEMAKSSVRPGSVSRRPGDRQCPATDPTDVMSQHQGRND